MHSPRVCFAGPTNEKPNNFSSWYQLRTEPSRKRDLILSPLASFLLPGFDQWWEGQNTAALTYTGLGLAGHVVVSSTDSNYSPRLSSWGSQLTLSAGGYSTYHSFRSAAQSRKLNGEFDFLKIEEEPVDLLLSPFRFDYLLRWTTLIPITTVAALMFVIFPSTYDGRTNFGNIGGGDAFYTLGTSYLAGTWEEGVFRGYFMPLSAYYTRSALLGNLLSGTAFALLHTTELKHLWHRLLWAWYIGGVSQHRDWTISETIFIHTWWDIIVFAGAYAFESNQMSIAFPTLVIPF